MNQKKECPNGSILNTTNRCIKINGPVYKKLLTAGKIVNGVIIRTPKQTQANKKNSAKTTQKSPKKNSPKNQPGQSNKCPPGSIMLSGKKRCTKIDGPTYKKYISGLFTECKEDDVFKCFKNFEKLKKVIRVGSGQYNIVYRVRAQNYPKDLVIKVTQESNTNLRKLKQFNEFEHIMSDLELGPKVHATHYIKDTHTDSKGHKRDIYDTVILMDYYPMSGADYKPRSQSEYNIVLIKSAMILKTMILKHGLYCIDIKPENFVVDPKGSAYGPDKKVIPDTRMIDFDVFCSRRLPKGVTPMDFYQLMLFQLIFTYQEYNKDKGMKIPDAILTEFKPNFEQLLNKYIKDKKHFVLYHYIRDKSFLKELLGKIKRGSYDSYSSSS
jgi:hypothetical protein